MVAALYDLNRRTSIRTKGVVYVVVLIVAIFLTVSAVVMTTVRGKLLEQLGDFHVSIVKKLALTASDALLSRDYGFLMDQIGQLTAAGGVSGVQIADRRAVVVAADAVSAIGAVDPELADFMAQDKATRREIEERPGALIMPVEIGGDLLGVARVTFDQGAEWAHVDQELGQTLRQLLSLALIIFTLGIGGAVVISNALTRSIVNLAREAERFDREIYPDEERPAVDGDRDETLRLRDSFLRMVANTRRYLREFRRLSEERQRLTCMATIGQMSAQIAHETRNSLHAIRGAITGLQKVDHPADAGDYIEVIKEEAEELTRMSEDFLRFARTPRPEVGPCGVVEVVGRVVELLDPDLEEAGVEVVQELDGTPLVLADPRLLKQAFMNLFLNAMQAMEGGGTLRVSGGVEDDRLVVRIHDTGPGIAPADAEKIFQPFFTTKSDGTGLGLATVYKMIVAQSGEIELESTAPGTTFAIRLRLVQGSPQ